VQDPGRRRPSARSWPRRLALSLAVGLATLSLAELGLRVGLSLRGKAYSVERVSEVAGEIASRARDTVPLPGGQEPGERKQSPIFLMPHPFVGWEVNISSAMLGGDIARLRRGGENPLRVMVLGGSVASIFHSLAAPLIRERLRDDPTLAGRGVEFLCYARGGYKQPQMLQYLCLMLSLELEPDVVLLIDGFNEVALAASNQEAGVHPIWPHHTQWLPLVLSIGSRPDLAESYAALFRGQEDLARRASRAASSPWLASALCGEWTLRRLRASEWRLQARTRRYLEELDRLTTGEIRGPKPPAQPRHAVERAVRNWRECSRLMHHLCRSRGIGFLHVLQPTLHDPGSKPVTAEEIEKGSILESWRLGVEHGYRLLRKAGADLPEEGVAFLDLSLLFAEVEETLYYDLCHFGEEGNRLMAEAVEPRLRELLREAAE
jgi:hypothetical protein